MEFWESNFSKNKNMWGFEPSKSAVWIKDFFQEKKLKDILIPGIGYGRNSKVFVDSGMNVEGIEISKTAIELAKENGQDIKIYHGSVSEMPFSKKIYDGIYSYALIHLLSYNDRKKFIQNCYNQLKSEGYMFFISVSKKARLFKKGREISKDTFEVMDGVEMFFYDDESIQEDFGEYGLVDFKEFYEENNDLYFTLIKCKKEI